MLEETQSFSGFVWLVGAGPG
ncbi:MAG: hypothetical protein JWQ62_1593, partial [Lacunisphaera sp.]|nr:hypothetical protein [Lacunisphaera sp.]